MPQALNSEKKRVECIDTMRGVCILLVNYFHSSISLFLAKYVSGICVHPFLFLAGYFYSRKLSVKENAIKKARSMLVPYYAFGLVYYVLWAVAMYSTGKDLISPLIAVLYMPIGSFPIESALYFLPMMFFSVMLFTLIEKGTHCEALRAVIVLGLTVLGNLWYHIFNARLPMSIDVSMSLLIYVYLGYHGRTILGFFDRFLKKIGSRAVRILLFVLAAALNSYLIDICPLANMRNGEWGFIPMTHLNTCVTMLLWVYFFRWFDTLRSMKPVSRALQYIGKNSMIFMCFSHIGLRIGEFIAYRLPLPMFGCKLIHYALSIIVILPVVFVFNKTKLHLIFGK